MSKPYKILFTMSEFMYGSKLRNICDLVRGMDKNQFQVNIAGLDIDDEAIDVIKNLDVPYYQIRTIPTIPYNIRRLAQTAVSPFKALGRQYDLVHSFLYQSVFTEPLIYRTCSRAKYIYTKSNLEWNNHKLNWKLKSLLSNKIISISGATKNLLTSKGFGHKIANIYLGIDTSQFKSSDEKRTALRNQYNIPDSSLVFGCAAQFVEWKEHITIIEAFEPLWQHNPDIHLIFAGPHHNDAYYQSVVKRISESPAKTHISMLGTVQDMTSFYSAIDCFILVSRNETFGYVYVEAMSCGKPVIACRAGGPMEIIVDNVTGYLIEMSSPHILANRMEKYLHNRTLLRDHGGAGRERAVKIFSTETMTEKCQKLYLQVIES